jgi:L-alanine-DL-glutamate epimerase-like enolase superfamily enzyme
VSLAADVEAPITGVDVEVFTIPTDAPESDGTLEWDATTIVVVEAHAGGETGLGYTYTHAAAAELVADTLQDAVRGCDALDVRQAWQAMSRSLRNIGRPGLGFMAISAVDIALWDLKARLVGMSLTDLLDAVHQDVPVYGSGGFCSYTDERLQEQLAGWVADGITRVKMKVGREPDRDPERVRAARAAIGDEADLYVDANGAFTERTATAFMSTIPEEDVVWFEEPVSSDDLDGLRRVRSDVGSDVDVAAGEYGDTIVYFRRMLEAKAVDCLQADVTRCGGITGLLQVATVAGSRAVDLSAHCAPAISAHAFCAVERLRHLEYFHDHVRVERMIFDGTITPSAGGLRPDRSVPGHGLTLKRQDAERWRAS